jgi:hypothetical protein
LFRIKLRAGIARGRSCASFLIIPQRKTSLCEALLGRAAMIGVGASMGAHGELTGEGEEGEGGGGEGSAARGLLGGAMGRGC